MLRRLAHDGWQDMFPAPGDAVGLAVADCAFHLLTAAGELWTRPFAAPGGWQRSGTKDRAVRLGGTNGRLFALDPDGSLLSRLPTDPHWTPFAETSAVRTFTAHAGWLITACDDELLRRRPVRRPPAGR
jgi:hypothetical protein